MRNTGLAVKDERLGLGRALAAGLLAGCVALAASPASGARLPGPGAGAEAGPPDLSICHRPRAALLPDAEVDLAEFVARLRGTFKLATRTIEGVLITAEAEYHFDLQMVSPAEARGRALLLDRGNLKELDPQAACPECQANAALGALWDVTVRRDPGRTLSLTMAGDYLGSYGEFRQGVRATETTTFVKLGDRYLAGQLVSPAGERGLQDTWDRIELTEGDFTYVSCKGRFLEHYAKVSNDRPLPEGVTLAERWEQKRRDGSLLTPVPVTRRSRSAR